MPSSSSGLHLVVGASGQVGGALLLELERRELECIGTYNKNLPEDSAFLQLDISAKSQVAAQLEKIRPAFIYLPASFTNVDACEENEALSLAVNVEGVQNVSEAAQAVGAKVVYFSSDYVFDGKDGPYDESTKVSPVSVYGRHKVRAEEIVEDKSGGDALIVRTTVVYGLERQKKNFVLRLAASLASGLEVPVPTDQVGSPTLNSALAATTIELVLRQEKGIFNVAGDELCSRYDLALAVAEQFELDEGLIVPITTDMLNQKAKRPLQAGLKVDKVRALLGNSAVLTGFHDGLRQLQQAVEEARSQAADSQ
jgi:dTDP-4-dehydrorhamnose reductase